MSIVFTIQETLPILPFFEISNNLEDIFFVKQKSSREIELAF